MNNKLFIVIQVVLILGIVETRNSSSQTNKKHGNKLERQLRASATSHRPFYDHFDRPNGEEDGYYGPPKSKDLSVRFQAPHLEAENFWESYKKPGPDRRYSVFDFPNDYKENDFHGVMNNLFRSNRPFFEDVFNKPDIHYHYHPEQNYIHNFPTTYKPPYVPYHTTEAIFINPPKPVKASVVKLEPVVRPHLTTVYPTLPFSPDDPAKKEYNQKLLELLAQVIKESSSDTNKPQPDAAPYDINGNYGLKDHFRPISPQYVAHVTYRPTLTSVPDFVKPTPRPENEILHKTQIDVNDAITPTTYKPHIDLEKHRKETEKSMRIQFLDLPHTTRPVEIGSRKPGPNLADIISHNKYLRFNNRTKVRKYPESIQDQLPPPKKGQDTRIPYVSATTVSQDLQSNHEPTEFYEVLSTVDPRVKFEDTTRIVFPSTSSQYNRTEPDGFRPGIDIRIRQQNSSGFEVEIEKLNIKELNEIINVTEPYLPQTTFKKIDQGTTPQAFSTTNVNNYDPKGKQKIIIEVADATVQEILKPDIDIPELPLDDERENKREYYRPNELTRPRETVIPLNRDRVRFPDETTMVNNVNRFLEDAFQNRIRHEGESTETYPILTQAPVRRPEFEVPIHRINNLTLTGLSHYQTYDPVSIPKYRNIYNMKNLIDFEIAKRIDVRHKPIPDLQEQSTIDQPVLQITQKPTTPQEELQRRKMQRNLKIIKDSKESSIEAPPSKEDEGVPYFLDDELSLDAKILRDTNWDGYIPSVGHVGDSRHVPIAIRRGGIRLETTTVNRPEYGTTFPPSYETTISPYSTSSFYDTFSERDPYITSSTTQRIVELDDRTVGPELTTLPVVSKFILPLKTPEKKESIFYFQDSNPTQNEILNDTTARTENDIKVNLSDGNIHHSTEKPIVLTPKPEQNDTVYVYATKADELEENDILKDGGQNETDHVIESRITKTVSKTVRPKRKRGRKYNKSRSRERPRYRERYTGDKITTEHAPKVTENEFSEVKKSRKEILRTSYRTHRDPLTTTLKPEEGTTKETDNEVITSDAKSRKDKLRALFKTHPTTTSKPEELTTVNTETTTRRKYRRVKITNFKPYPKQVQESTTQTSEGTEVTRRARIHFGVRTNRTKGRKVENDEEIMKFSDDIMDKTEEPVTKDYEISKLTTKKVRIVDPASRRYIYDRSKYPKYSINKRGSTTTEPAITTVAATTLQQVEQTTTYDIAGTELSVTTTLLPNVS